MRLLTAIAIILLVLAVTAGCSHKGDGKVTLILTAWGNEREEKTLRSLIGEFEKNYPNIHVELQIIPHARVFDKLMISTAGGRPPDVSRISSLWFHTCAEKGLFENLDPYIKRDKTFDIHDFYQEAVEGWGKHNGRVYAIPTDIDVYAMYFNRNTFDRAGIPYPNWTWDWNDYLAAARKLTKDTDGDGRTDQWGTSLDQFWQSYIYQNGGSIVSADFKKCTLNEPKAWEALQWMCDLINREHVAPGVEETAQIGARKLFTSGRLGMFISGSWDAELNFKDQIKGFEYDAAPLPKGKMRTTFIGGAAYAILSRSKHKREAWELVKWMTGAEYQRRAAVDSQIIPSRKSVAESGAFLKLKKPPNNRAVFLQMIQYGRPLPPVACAQEMNEVIGAELALALLGKESAKTACEKVTPKVNQLLRNSE